MEFIAFVLKKFLRIQKETKFLSTISIISIFGVSLGVIILNIALAVLNGFEREIENRLIGFNLHIVAEGYEGKLVDYNDIELNKLRKLVGDDLDGISPFAGQLALVKFSRFKEGVYLKGILPEYDYSNLRSSIIEGKYLLLDKENFPTIIIGKKLARKIGVNVGDTLTAFMLQSFVLPLDIEHLKMKKFIVAGIFESGMSEYDDANAFIHLRAAQDLFGFEGKISGYEIKLKNPQNADYLSIVLSSNLGYPYNARSIFQTYRNIFNWIELQKKPIPIVLALITIVAIFNVISTLLIFVMDKTNSIGILKTLGASTKQIKTIFLLNGFIIGLVGTISGNLIAILLLIIQKRFDVIKIPEGVYFLDKVPISIELESFLIVSFVSLVISVLFSFLPARFAAKVDIIKSIKFS